MNPFVLLGILALLFIFGSLLWAFYSVSRKKRYVFNAESHYKARAGETETLSPETHDFKHPAGGEAMTFETHNVKGPASLPPPLDDAQDDLPVPKDIEYGLVEGLDLHIAFLPPTDIKPYPVLVDKWLKVFCNKNRVDASDVVLHVTNANSRPSGKLRVREIRHHKNFRELALNHPEIMLVEIRVDGYKPRAQAKLTESFLNWELDPPKHREVVETIRSFDDYLKSDYRRASYREAKGDLPPTRERLMEVSDADSANYAGFVDRAGLPFVLKYNLLPGGRRTPDKVQVVKYT
jgi:hypothetical protein